MDFFSSELLNWKGTNKISLFWSYWYEAVIYLILKGNASLLVNNFHSLFGSLNKLQTMDCYQQKNLISSKKYKIVT